MTHTTTLYSAAQGHQTLAQVWAWAKPKLLQGTKLRLSIGEEKRSLPQNDHIQKLVRNIGAKIGRRDHDKLRLLLCEQWRTETKRPAMFMPSLDGLRMVDVSNSTSNLDKGDGSEFIEWLIAENAQLGGEPC